MEKTYQIELTYNGYLDIDDVVKNISFATGVKVEDIHIKEKNGGSNETDFKKMAARVEYKWKCKHYADGVCMKRSGCSGDWHAVSFCDEDCERMKNYDKKKGAANE